MNGAGNTNSNLYHGSAKGLLPCYARHGTYVKQEPCKAPQSVQRVMESPGEVKDCSRSHNKLVAQLAVEFLEESLHPC